MKNKLFGLAAVALLSVGLVACNGEEAAPTETETTTEATTETTTETAGNVVEVNLTATNFEFDQKEIKANVGDTVKITLKNEAGLHGVEVDGFGKVTEGETLEFTVTEAGEIEFWCNIMCGQGHTEMTGKIIVS